VHSIHKNPYFQHLHHGWAHYPEMPHNELELVCYTNPNLEIVPQQLSNIASFVHAVAHRSVICVSRNQHDCNTIAWIIERGKLPTMDSQISILAWQTPQA